VIIGGGIGGLLAAHALAGRFDRVTVFERGRYPLDACSPAPPARRGVSQSRCLHLLVAAGATVFDELMPAWREEALALGATPFDACADAALRFSTGWLPRSPSGITTYACSRALLESVLRRGLAGKATVFVRESRKVTGLLGSPLGERVTGVCIAGGHADESIFPADLVVDASGAGSTLTRWIAALPNGGTLQMNQTVVKTGKQYVSRWFHLEPGDAPDWHCLSIAPAANTQRSAMMLRAEHNRWGVVLLTGIGKPLPSDDEAFMDFVAEFGDGELRRVLGRGRPVSPIYHYGPTASRMIHFDRLTTWPAGLVAIGDSVCTLDPYFGLGMTAAARGAVLLARYLDRDMDRTPRGLDFQKELASLNAQPWRLVTGRDSHGRTLAHDRAHLERLRQIAPSSPKIAHALLSVQHLLRPTETLREIAV
jgi:2-polyprenyl-6-methoxyphenol hydroxylase-like FAD-dependent oxidoreductase